MGVGAFSPLAASTGDANFLLFSWRQKPTKQGQPEGGVAAQSALYGGNRAIGANRSCIITNRALMPAFANRGAQKGLEET